MYILIAFVIVIILILTVYVVYSSYMSYNGYKAFYSNTIRLQKTTDNGCIEADKYCYEVVEPHNKNDNENDKQDAAVKLSAINRFILDLIDYMKKRFNSAKTTYPNYKNINPYEITIRLQNKYTGSSVISEHRPKNLTETSYALNKEYIRFCLRNPENNDELHHLSILKFVALHEVSHFAAISYDHPDEFWEIFKFLLEMSEDSGLYMPIDYSKQPEKYCGLNIMYNPYFDESI